MAIATEVLVIGAGPGGYVCAIKLGKLGKKVLLVDRDKLGGECLNYGCIPSKALIHAAGARGKAAKAGLEKVPAPDWTKIQAWKGQMVGGFNKNVGTLVQGNKGQILLGEAVFAGPHEAKVKTSTGVETVQFEHAVIATGTRPLPIPGFAFDGKNILSSKEALELCEPPTRLVVIGGGVIGLEIGTVYAKLGSKVTIVEFMPNLLPGLEPDMVAPVARNLQKLGVEFLLQSKAKSWKKAGKTLSVTVETPEGEKLLEADKILLAVGRGPVTQELGLSKAGVKTDAKGHVQVDETGRTSAAHIYAIGDVIGAPYLAHKASREGILAAEAIAGFHAQARGAVPWAVFTDPEISWVGETETEAKARGAEVLVGRFPFAASGRGQAVRETEGFAKVVCDAETHRILGAGFVGAAASDLIGEACLAVSIGATADDVAAAIHPHPTFCEAFQEACEASLGQAIHIMAGAAGRR